jgi:hypothetical protein
MKGWIGVDLDGTLAVYHTWQGPTEIGPPVDLMLARVKQWLAEGEDVRIFTARVSHDGTPARALQAQEARKAVGAWCKQWLGVVLPVTCVKDWSMVELYDDRAVQVEKNTGRLVGYSTRS